jgi:hypothetical protein
LWDVLMFQSWNATRQANPIEEGAT